MVCVEDPTEDLDYVSKMYEYDSGTVLVTFPLLSFTKQRGLDTGVQAEVFLSHPPPYILERFSGYGTPFFH